MKKIYLLDRHITMTGDLDFRMTTKGHRVINCSLSDHWYLRYLEEPAKNLTYVTKGDIHLPSSHDDEIYAKLAKKFQLEEKLHQPDYFCCGFPPPLFTLFRECEAPTILNLFFRFEGNSKVTRERFDKLIEMAIESINNKQLYVYAASHYDAAYFKYFTGIEVPRLYVTCRYLNHLQWDINKVQTDAFLIFNGRRGQYPDHQRIIDQYLQWFAKHTNIKLTTALSLAPWPSLLQRGVRKLRRKLPIKRRPSVRIRNIGYTWSSLLRYKALVFFPYSSYSGTMLECLSMGIPLFLPSQKLMKELHRQYHILPERTSRHMEKTQGKFSTLAYGKHLMPDPNDDLDLEAAHYWLERCEWFRWQVRYFDSPQDLYEKLKSADFPRLHQDIKKTWWELDTQSEQQWGKVLGDSVSS